MKGKIPSILAILFALSLVLGLAASIAPASIVAAATDKWDGVTLPTELAYAVFPGSEVGPIALGNSTIYAAVDNGSATDNWAIYTSTDGGFKWTKGDVIKTAKDNGDIVAIVLSPDQKTLYVATDSTIAGSGLYSSLDGGKTLDKLDVVAPVAGTITSMDVSKDSSGREIVVIGTTTGVYTYNENGFLSWKDKALGVGAFAVKCSINYAADKVIIAVTATGVSTYKNGAFNDKIAASVIPGGVATGAVIALPSDFNIDSTPFCYVGLAGGALDVWKVELVKTAVAPTKLNPSTTGAVTVTSLVATGPDASVKLFVGGSDPVCAGQGQVYTGTNLGTFPGWQASWMAPSGQAPFIAYDGTNLYCATSDGLAQSAFSHATSGEKGQTWQARGLVDEEVTDYTSATVYAVPTGFSASAGYASINGSTGDKTAFMVINDQVSGASASVWRTTDGGTTWEKVISQGTTTPKGDAINGVKLSTSPDFATTKTAFILTDIATAGTGKLWYTTDGGNTWQKTHTAPTVATTAILTTLKVVDQKTVIIGDSLGNVYRTTDRGNAWNDVVNVAAIYITSIAVSSDCIAVAGYDTVAGTTSSAWLSQDSGKTFIQVGPEAFTTNSLAGNRSAYLAFGADSNTLYFAVSGVTTGQPGIYRTAVDKASPASSSWEKLVAASTITTGNEIKFAGFGTQGSTLYLPVTTFNATTTTVNESGVSRILDGTVAVEKVKYDLVNGGLLTGTQVTSLQAVKGSTILFSIVKNSNGITKVMKYSDTLISAPGTVAGSLTPADKATGVGSIQNNGDAITANVQLIWGSITADQYEWQVSLNSAFGNTVASGTTEQNTVTVPDLGLATTYYWRVRATEPVLGPWSAASSFTTTTGTIGTIDTPAIGEATVVDDSAVFTWASVLKATSYKIQISKDYSFTSPTEQTVTTTAYKADNLDEGTYFWRVKAVPASGEASVWSAAGSFAVGAEAAGTSSSTPAWVWVLIVLGVILAIFVLVLILRTRRPV